MSDIKIPDFNRYKGMSAENVEAIAKVASQCGNPDLLQKISEAFNDEHLSACADISGYRRTAERMSNRARLKWIEAIAIAKS